MAPPATAAAARAGRIYKYHGGGWETGRQLCIYRIPQTATPINPLAMTLLTYLAFLSLEEEYSEDYGTANGISVG